MAGLPPLPKIDGDVDLMLDVYTHSSLRFENAPQNDDYGDTDRLAELGAKVLELVVTYHVYSVERPMLSQSQIQERTKEYLSYEHIGMWLDHYGLKHKLRAPVANMDALLNDPAEMTKYFNTYVGALYVRSGLATVQHWISALITPGADVRPPGLDGVSQFPDGRGAFYQSIHQSMPQHFSPQSSPGPNYSTASPGFVAASPGPPQGFGPIPPSTAPPPLPSTPFHYAPSSTLSLVTLALFNQTASQRGYTVSYPAESVGPPHQPTWTVKCCLNGEERSRAVAKSQKLAKEEAARQAWAAMGWGPS